jgi:hydrogenase expression/formation protein HypE
MSERITMTHGAGGEAMHTLLRDVVVPLLHDARAEVGLRDLDDSGVIEDIVFTTDGHTVKPLFYPGGDIGRLSVCGTINDISAMGAEPLALALGMLMEDGLPIKTINSVMKSISRTCMESGVPVITGDTKVVEKGAIEQLMITTSAVGLMGSALKKNNKIVRESEGRKQKWLLDKNLRDGDDIIITGTIGDHGMALMSFREGYGFETTLKSDNAPLNKLMAGALNVGGIVSAKDPTRGGVASLLNDWSSKSKIGIIIDEEELPIREEVRSVSELLGIDPLEVGNEGKFVLAVIPEMTDAVLKAIKRNKYGKNARVIGKASKKVKRVVMETVVGGKRIVEVPVGDPVPRIC